MNVKIITKKADWDDFLLTQNSPFLQSWEWGEVLISEGKLVTRLGVYQEEKILALAQIIESNFPLGLKYGFCPGGPVVSPNLIPDEVGNIYQTFYAYAHERGLAFLRVEPICAPVGVQVKKIKDVNPSTTLILDLVGTQEQYWENLDKKTRYEINQAKKRGVDVKEEKSLNLFLPLLSETSQREGFSTHAEIHYEKILASPQSRQLVAYFQDKPVASAIFWQWGDTISYLFAATSRRYGHLSASHLIQERIIAWARAEGLKHYDFFGIAPRLPGLAADYEYDRSHRYAGFTKFKLGFGGRIVERAGTFEIIASPVKYKMYNFQRRLRRLL